MLVSSVVLLTENTNTAISLVPWPCSERLSKSRYEATQLYVWGHIDFMMFVLILPVVTI